MSKDELKALVIDYADSYSIDRGIALVQIQRESDNYRQDVVYGPFVGAAGEKGMSQFTPGTWARFGNGSHDNAYDPDYAMTAWGAYMQWLLDRYGWDYSKALMGYNGGEGNVDKGTVSSAARNYAASILQNAGKIVSYDISGDLSPLADSLPSSGSTIFGLPIALALAIGGFGLWLALKD